MPWIKKEDCTGCGICVLKCRANAIVIKENKATIIDEECIRCGVCHQVCPNEAVRHDSEKIPFEVDENIKWVNDLLANYETQEEKNALLNRVKKFFNKEIKVANMTLEKIDSML